MFTVTKEWLDKNKTKAGGYTREQIDAFGFGWPPPKGWKNHIIGKDITHGRRIHFEESRLGKRSNKLINVKKLASFLSRPNLVELKAYIERLLTTT